MHAQKHIGLAQIEIPAMLDFARLWMRKAETATEPTEVVNVQSDVQNHKSLALPLLKKR